MKYRLLLYFTAVCPFCLYIAACADAYSVPLPENLDDAKAGSFEKKIKNLSDNEKNILNDYLAASAAARAQGKSHLPGAGTVGDAIRQHSMWVFSQKGPSAAEAYEQIMDERRKNILIVFILMCIPLLFFAHQAYRGIIRRNVKSPYRLLLAAAGKSKVDVARGSEKDVHEWFERVEPVDTVRAVGRDAVKIGLFWLAALVAVAFFLNTVLRRLLFLWS